MSVREDAEKGDLLGEDSFLPLGSVRDRKLMGTPSHWPKGGGSGRGSQSQKGWGSTPTTRRVLWQWDRARLDSPRKTQSPDL